MAIKSDHNVMFYSRLYESVISLILYNKFDLLFCVIWKKIRISKKNERILIVDDNKMNCIIS